MFSLLPYNTFGLDVQAREGRLIHEPALLQQGITSPFVILGSGSDVLFTEDFDGLALINCIRGLEISKRGHNYHVRAGGGMLLDNLIEQLLDKGIFGLENLSAIPGTVGAAPIQNVGAYGVEIGDFIESVEVCDLGTHELLRLSKDECAFGYRTSYFKQHKDKPYFVLYVNFVFPDMFIPRLSYSGLQDKALQDARAVREEVMALRSRKLPDPRFTGNAGSFFKNPVVPAQVAESLREQYPDMPVFTAPSGDYKLAAGWLIDRAGCRGITHGQAGTWEHQALVIVNRGQARPHEIVALGKYVCACVKDKFGLDLEPEVRLYGRNGETEWHSL